MQAARGQCVSTRVPVSTLAALPPAGEYCGVLRTDWREPLRHAEAEAYQASQAARVRTGLVGQNGEHSGKG